MTKPQILLTNDDGIRSPGLWAAAEVLSMLGFVHVVAPRDQFSGAGRSMPSTSDGIITERQVQVNGKTWTVYAVGGTPAQTVQHAILEIMSEPPALVVSGINYGENVGSGITVSGTVGAALEAAALGYPALAVSLETAQEHHLSYSEEVDFAVAAHFTSLFARILLDKKMPPDVHVLKLDVPAGATTQTPWEVTRVSRLPYFKPVKPQRDSWEEPAVMGYTMGDGIEQDENNSDAYALRVKEVVSVSPLSLDMTSRIDLEALEHKLCADP